MESNDEFIWKFHYKEQGKNKISTQEHTNLGSDVSFIDSDYPGYG